MSVTDERLRFVARLLEGEGMSEMCREFGTSRKADKIFFMGKRLLSMPYCVECNYPQRLRPCDPLKGEIANDRKYAEMSEQIMTLMHSRQPTSANRDRVKTSVGARTGR